MDKAPIKNSEPMRAWALVVAGEAVTTTKAVIANAWRAAGLEVTELTAAHPTQQGLDAQRWQIVHNRISGEYIAGRAHFVVQLAPVPEANIMRGSIAEHFVKAVDFAAAQAKQGEQP